MSKHKKTKHKKTTPSLSLEHGFDYAFPPRAMGISSVDFSNLLTEAKIIAIAYSLCPHPRLGRRIPLVTLVGRNAEPLRKAFQELKRWVEISDGDAIEMTFIFLNEGGYILSIGSDFHRLKQRTLGFDRVHSPLLMGVSWIKNFDTTGPHVLGFQEYCKQLISPFCLNAACYRGIVTGSHPDPAMFEDVAHPNDIVKFNATFFIEANLLPDSQAAYLLKAYRSNHRRSSQGRKRTRPEAEQIMLSELHKQRMKMLSVHFPVTIERIRISPKIATMKSSLAPLGVADWQITQAICNLILSREILPGNLHFQGIFLSDLRQKVAEALGKRFEIAGGDRTILDDLSIDTVVAQVRLDSIALLDGIQKKPKMQDLESLLQELKKEHLLAEEPDSQ